MRFRVESDLGSEAMKMIDMTMRLDEAEIEARSRLIALEAVAVGVLSAPDIVQALRDQLEKEEGRLSLPHYCGCP
jgi:hypothetical protein